MKTEKCCETSLQRRRMTLDPDKTSCSQSEIAAFLEGKSHANINRWNAVIARVQELKTSKSKVMHIDRTATYRENTEDCESGLEGRLGVEEMKLRN
ncbi:hypothetical protein NPIL_204301 [Nephila pilipes]|uniref:Uncharacterized protein n=1 Tax=Nephila pilipes TaxID=299642 RepID=A0A8X6QWZ8_NEPPI|nr:hypothetical protein NPIL_204301 [Nephila pilipes]